MENNQTESIAERNAWIKPGDTVWGTDYNRWWFFGEPKVASWKVESKSNAGRVKFLNHAYTRGYVDWMLFPTKEAALEHYGLIVDKMISHKEREIQSLREFRKKIANG